MLDLQETLQEWRKYQHSKRTVQLAKMDEIKTFPCLASFQNTYIKSYLKIIENAIERYLLIISQKRKMGLPPTTLYKIPLASLRGYERENNSNILLTLMEEEVVQEEELEIEPIVLQFINADILDAAFTAIREFGRERVKNLDAPPSTFESD